MVDKMRTSLERSPLLRRWSAAVFAILAAASAGQASQQAFTTNEHPGAVPIPTRLGGELCWVAGSELVARSGRPDAYRINTLFGDILQQYFEKELDRPSPVCLRMYPNVCANGGRFPRSFEEFVSRANQILRGEVTGASGGFCGMSAGLLIQVRVTEWIKREQSGTRTAAATELPYLEDTRLMGARGPEDAQYVYFFYPGGNFNIGRLKVCSMQRRWLPTPSVGDDVLLFPRGRGPPEYYSPDLVRVSIDGSETVLENRHGIRVPEILGKFEEFKRATSIDELAAAMSVINFVDTAAAR